MRLMTKGGRPLKRSNADPRFNQSATIYFYRTFGGRIEVRIFENKQDSNSRLWKRTGKAAILHDSEKVIEHLRKLFRRLDLPGITSASSGRTV